MKHHSWTKLGTSIFTAMTQAANRFGAVNLAQGFPNFDGPDEVKLAAIEAIKGSWNQYAPSHGVPQLRKLLKERMSGTSGVTYDSEEEITIFSGATEALFCSFLAFFDEGDEILTFAPYFDCYPAGAFAVRAKLIEVPMEPSTWTFTAADLAARVTKNTKAILVNTPHNPTGRVFTHEEMTVIADFAKAHNLLVITDEVYEELVYDEKPFTRMCSLPGMRERTVVISSTAKTFSFTGWKVGFIFAPAALTRELRAVHQFTVFCSATPLQVGLCRALEMPGSYFTTLRSDYTARRDFLFAALIRLGFRVKNAEGTYFLVADYSALSELPDKEFALWLAETHKVATIPTSVFYNDPQTIASQQHHVRFAFCKDLGTLELAVANLERLTV